jgi:hypothetical protein
MSIPPLPPTPPLLIGIWERNNARVKEAVESIPGEFELRRLPGRYRMAHHTAGFVLDDVVHVVIDCLQADGTWVNAWRGPIEELKREIKP